MYSDPARVPHSIQTPKSASSHYRNGGGDITGGAPSEVPLGMDTGIIVGFTAALVAGYSAGATGLTLGADGAADTFGCDGAASVVAVDHPFGLRSLTVPSCEKVIRPADESVEIPLTGRVASFTMAGFVDIGFVGLIGLIGTAGLVGAVPVGGTGVGAGSGCAPCGIGYISGEP